MSDDRVCVRTGANGVATVTMVRSDKHNALDQAMFEGLMNAAEQLANDASVRAVVLHGEGKSFCSGLDIASFMSGQGGTSVLLVRDDDRLANVAQRVAYDWSLVPAPVIAAIHGNCFGGGLQIALGADIRIAAPDAKLCVLEIKWGLVPDMGITHLGPGVPSMYSTPSMVSLIEMTCVRLIGHHVDAGEHSVGYRVNIKHLKPTTIGQKVTARVRLREVNGRRCTFDVEVHNEDGTKIGEGEHERAVIDIARFAGNARRSDCTVRPAPSRFAAARRDTGRPARCAGGCARRSRG